MKKWQEPKLSNLGIESTKDEGCPYENEVASTPSAMTLFPVIVWGDGKIGCTYWDCTKKGCTNPNYGQKGKCWPCPQAKKDVVGAS